MNAVIAFVSRHRKVLIGIAVVVLLLAVKVVWVESSCRSHGSVETEKTEILQRRNYLVEKVVVEPEKLIGEMPRAIGRRFQGEWALYSCSMLTAALANIADTYPETSKSAAVTVDSLIRIVMSPELRAYDCYAWGEDPLETLDGDNSHMSYLSHLAWMIGNYDRLGGDGRYSQLHDSICFALNRRILQSETLNIDTYPYEPIYIPDMLVAIVALSDYSCKHSGRYADTVKMWLARAKSDWCDSETGLLASSLDDKGRPVSPVRGSYSALSCYYLTLVAPNFAKEQYEALKTCFGQDFPVSGIREFHDRSCWLGLDVDSGPVILNLSPSGTAFAIGSATYFDDTELRDKLLRSAEIAGHTVKWNDSRHYLLSGVALVGEAITLAMRTNRFRETFLCPCELELYEHDRGMNGVSLSVNNP